MSLKSVFPTPPPKYCFHVEPQEKWRCRSAHPPKVRRPMRKRTQPVFHPWLPLQTPVSTGIHTDTHRCMHTRSTFTQTPPPTHRTNPVHSFLGPAPRPTNSSKHFRKYFGSGDDAGHTASGILELTQARLWDIEWGRGRLERAWSHPGSIRKCWQPCWWSVGVKGKTWTGHSFLEQRGKAFRTSKLRSRRLGEGIKKGVGGTWHLAHPWLLPCG